MRIFKTTLYLKKEKRQAKIRTPRVIDHQFLGSYTAVTPTTATHNAEDCYNPKNAIKKDSAKRSVCNFRRYLIQPNIAASNITVYGWQYLQYKQKKGKSQGTAFTCNLWEMYAVNSFIDAFVWMHRKWREWDITCLSTKETMRFCVFCYPLVSFYTAVHKGIARADQTKQLKQRLFT